MVVSIIIPHFNNEKGLSAVLQSLISQENFSLPYEIIVVDNGSSIDLSFIKSFNDVVLVHENRFLNSPYSARNRGIEVSHGQIIAFLDSTCTPCSTWLSAGVKCILNEADIVGGGIEFILNADPSLYEIYDSIFHVNPELATNNGFVLGGNFFLKSHLFDILGKYKEGLRTSGDFVFSQLATSHGFKIKFCPNARVDYPARGKKFVFKKNWRISMGQPDIWQVQDKFFVQFLKSFGKLIFPNPYKIVKKVKNRYPRELSVHDLIIIYFLRYLMLFISFFGNMRAILLRKS